MEKQAKMTIQLPLLNTISLKKVDGEYSLAYAPEHFFINNKPFDLDINFKELNELSIQTAKRTLENLSSIHKKCREYIMTDYQSSTETQYYLKEWSQEILPQIFDEAELQNFLSRSKAKEKDQQLLELLSVVRTGIYIDDEKAKIVNDFAFGYDIESGFRDDMLAVYIDEQFNLITIVNEG